MTQPKQITLSERPTLGIVISVEIPNGKLKLAKADMQKRATDFGLTSHVFREARGTVVPNSTKVDFAVVPVVKPMNNLQYDVIEQQVMEFQAIWQGTFVLQNMDKEILAEAMKGNNSNNVEGMD